MRRRVTRIMLISELADLWARSGLRRAYRDEEDIATYVTLHDHYREWLDNWPTKRLVKIYEQQVLKGTNKVQVVDYTKRTFGTVLREALDHKPVCPQART